MNSGHQIMDSEGMNRALTRMAHEILERNKSIENLILIGVRRRGAVLAERLAELIKSIDGTPPPVGAIDINLYRDDLSTVASQPIVRETEIPLDLKDQKVVVVDDVLFTGRTIRSALVALMDFGRPQYIQLAVLVDRGHRELPIRPDYVGKNLPTNFRDVVHVNVREIDDSDEVMVEVSNE